MFDNRDFRERRSCSCSASCIGLVIWALTAIFFFVVGAIVGAFASAFVTGAIVPIAIFAIILFLAIVIALFLACCKNRR